ncbi:protein kinase [Thermopolyspora sp. NPDC052614]|uniref:serine/threonine protein kinase n=1 Tax=Thermopolyspora sp. NPDC052614 TaxID=3155682 RepID=UPI0034338F65
MPEEHTRLLADRYELTAPVGRGTMGTVWRAWDRSLGREVAVKQIRQEPGLTPEQQTELRERMIREGRIAARFNHPSVATVHDAIVVDDSPWIIMELVEGRSLEQVIDEEGPLPPRLVAEIGVDLLSALRAAHGQGILHRDVKPSNVLLTETGRVVLTDFGIAKGVGDSNLTKTGMVIGSPGYTAPERARGDYAGPESDLWSLGATLYFAVEGRPAYERGSVAATLAALMTETADPPTQAGPLRPILDGLLEKDHTLRLTSDQADAMLRAVAAGRAPDLSGTARPVHFGDQSDGPRADETFRMRRGDTDTGPKMVGAAAALGGVLGRPQVRDDRPGAPGDRPGGQADQPYGQTGYDRSDDPYGRPGGQGQARGHGQASGPYDQPGGPYDQPGGPYDQPGGPYDQPGGPYERRGAQSGRPSVSPAGSAAGAGRGPAAEAEIDGDQTMFVARPPQYAQPPAGSVPPGNVFGGDPRGPSSGPTGRPRPADGASGPARQGHFAASQSDGPYPPRADFGSPASGAGQPGNAYPESSRFAPGGPGQGAFGPGPAGADRPQPGHPWQDQPRPGQAGPDPFGPPPGQGAPGEGWFGKPSGQGQSGPGQYGASQPGREQPGQGRYGMPQPGHDQPGQGRFGAQQQDWPAPASAFGPGPAGQDRPGQAPYGPAFPGQDEPGMPGSAQSGRPGHVRGAAPYGMGGSSGPTRRPDAGQPGHPHLGRGPHDHAESLFDRPAHEPPQGASARQERSASGLDEATIDHRRGGFPGVAVPGAAGPGVGGPGAAGPGVGGPGAAGPGIGGGGAGRPGMAAPGQAGPGAGQGMPYPEASSPQAAPFGWQGTGPGGPGGPDTDPPGLGTEIFELSGVGDKPKRPARVESRTGMFLLMGIALAGLAVIVILVASALSSSGDAKPTGSSASIGKGQVAAPPTAGSSAKAVAPTSSPTGTIVQASGSPETGDPSDRPTADGLRKHTGPGFTIDVPTGMKASVHGGKLSFSAGDPSRQITVETLAKPRPDVLRAAQAAEDAAIAKGSYPDYRLVKLGLVTPPPYPGTDVADWEFTHTADGQVLHILTRWVTVPAGKSYVIHWSAPHASWNDDAPGRAMVLDSFSPARADSPGGS